MIASWQRHFRLPRGRLALLRRHLHSTVERVEIPCRSSGSITVDLHRTSREPSTEPLLIHIPAFAPAPGDPPYTPPFLDSFPTAVINYRWPGPYVGDQALEPLETEEEVVSDFATSLHWPTPIHDLLFGYSWIVEHLSPLSLGRRDIYVHGAYLGATLAASLALTECHRHERFAVRGFAAYNGIYNWTMFLPDHKVNKPTGRGTKTTPSLPPASIEGTPLHALREEMPVLFKEPTDLFDPFASPSLQFQTAGLLVPPSFHYASGISAMVDRMAALGLDGSAADLMPTAAKPPRRSALVFPPRKSTLRIPETLLLHDTAVQPAAAAKTKRKTTVTTRTAARRKLKGNHFAAQAEELGGLMRRSLEKVELKERMKWDGDLEDMHTEIEARVKIIDAGEPVEGELQMNGFGEDVVRTWLEDHMSRPYT